MNKRALAYRDALAVKKKTPGMSDAQFANEVEKRIANPENYGGLDAAIVQESEYQTFRNRLTGSTKMIQSALHKSGVGRLIVPFMRTPWNIVTFGMERTPILHFISKKWREDFAAGGARRDIALAKAEIGYLAAASLLGLAMNGLITGGGPKDKKEKAAWLRSGKKPWSVKIGDTYYSFQNFDPFAIPLGVIAAVGETMSEIDDADLGDIIAALSFGFAENVVNKNYLSSLSDAISAIRNPERYGERWWTNMLSNMSPMVGAQRWARRVFDPSMRNVKGLTEESVRGEGFTNEVFLEVGRTLVNKIKYNAPGFSEDLPQRLNMWGEPIMIEGGTPWRAASPLYKSYEKHSVPDTEFIRLQQSGVDIATSMPNDQIKVDGITVPLTAWEYNAMIGYMNAADFGTGKNLKETLTEVIDSDYYEDMGDEEKADELNGYIKNAKTFGQNMLAYESKYSKDIQKYVDEQIKAKQQGR